MSREFIRCRLAHFRDGYSSPSESFEYIEDAIVVLSEGKFEAVYHAKEANQEGINENAVVDKRPSLMMPGFIDAHVHSAQINMIASYGAQLLEWLNNYTFPEEEKFAELSYATAQAEHFIDALLANGTTTAFVFPTSHKHSAHSLFETALSKNMRLIAGKVLMDRNAPESLLDGELGISDTRELIKHFHGKGRLGYAITPRFSGTSTPKQLAEAGKLLEDVPDLWVQTHLSENHDEIEWTKSLFPEAKDYLDTYEMHGLHSERSIYAHCIHLNDRELRRISDCGSSIAFCPSSNLFLGSGLLNLERLHNAGASYCIATDVGAGTSLSMLKTLGDAYKVAQLNGYSMHALEAFYASTLGAAKTLHLNKQIGSIEAGKEADFILLDANLNSTIKNRLSSTNKINDELFIYMIMGDERLIKETYIAGECVYRSTNSLGAMLQ